ncbi:Hydrophobin-3 [Leucoagaricus sp. SymC.cos]|nr:Hydrophobin-3 [Leucoagaricus sp. SymC.cos]
MWIRLLYWMTRKTSQGVDGITPASDPSVGTLAGLLGITLGPITGLVGLNCNPISAIVSIGGDSCSAQPMCCDNNNFVS